jgi:hypothetical protein
MTGFLQFLSNRTPLFDPAVPILERSLARCATTQIIDLGSGGGGGLLRLNAFLRGEVPDLHWTLTDLYPNLDAFRLTRAKAGNLKYISEPVDARQVPESLKGLRTLFLCLHHFRPADARKILQDALDDGQGIAIFEGQERTLPSLLAMLLSPLSVLLTTPFIRPFRWGRILFTYIIPLVPVFTLWDGVVSALRTYSVPEMNDLIAGLKGGERFEWETGRLRSGPGVLLYLTGVPKTTVPELAKPGI